MGKGVKDLPILAQGLPHHQSGGFDPTVILAGLISNPQLIV